MAAERWLLLWMRVCRVVLSFGFIFSATLLMGQQQVNFAVVDADSGEPLVGATVQVEGTSNGTITDAEGKGQLVIAGSTARLTASYVGYHKFSLQVTSGTSVVTIEMEPEEELEEVVVRATRSSRTISDLPTRIEVISGEELGEKAAMNSTNIAMLLRESTGIQMQQTSANSANQTLRIQGLDGRYTQLLRDGFPLYSGFSSGLSIMQIPPLDLAQVEVVKGSASTLYGGGAIAGLVNLVTKEPEEEPERMIMLNQTTAGGSTLNAFFSGRKERAGYTVYVSGNRQQPYDPNRDGFSDIPKVRSLTVNPKLFLYPSERTSIDIGLNSSYDRREGGDVLAIDGEPSNDHFFTETNVSGRLGSQVDALHTTASGAILNLKNSVNTFVRDIDSPLYAFHGLQVATFTELSYAATHNKHENIAGINIVSDRFVEPTPGFFPPVPGDDRSYTHLTYGAFGQDTWELSERHTLETGLRADYSPQFGFFLLPRFSWMYEPIDALTLRLGGGRGYKLPTIFLEDGELRAFDRVLAYAANDEKPVAETSIGANFDINYTAPIGEEWTLSVNQLLFVTQLKNSVFLNPEAVGSFTNYYLTNRHEPLISRGLETNLKLAYDHLKLFLQYSFISTQVDSGSGYHQKTLTPKHNAGFVLMYEKHGSFRIGYELYYTGSQFRSDFSTTPNYWIMGLMAMKEWERFSLFLNFENFTDTRITRFQEVVEITQPLNIPRFSEIWAPTDGFVTNGGFIFSF